MRSEIAQQSLMVSPHPLKDFERFSAHCIKPLLAVLWPSSGPVDGLRFKSARLAVRFARACFGWPPVLWSSAFGSPRS